MIKLNNKNITKIYKDNSVIKKIIKNDEILFQETLPTIQEAWIDAGLASWFNSNNNRVVVRILTTELPEVSDGEKLISTSIMCSGCTSLTGVSLFNTENVTNMSMMFYDCTSLTGVPLFETSNVTSMSSMFYNCTSLTGVPLFNTSDVTGMGSMFYNCSSLTGIPQLNANNVTGMSSMFYNCSSLTSCGIINIGVNVSFINSPLLIKDSIILMFNGLKTVSTTRTFTLNSTAKANLSANDIAIATQKGWNVA